MTIRKLWLLILIAVAIFSVAVNSLIFSTLTDRYFKDYLSESYEIHINQIISYTKNVLASEDTTQKQIEMQLEAHLTDPIIEIKLYSPEGNLLAEVYDDYQIPSNMMPGMMRSMMNKDTSDEVRQYELFTNNKLVGYLNVTSHSVAENSFVAKKFNASLFSNSIISVFIVSILVIILGIIISRKMSKSLIETAKMATNIQQGSIDTPLPTNIREVNAIRDSIEDLDVKLRLKQKSRKTLIDSLLHQTRTPLTILKSHLEAIEDGVIEVSETELSIFQNQIENLTSIITNMSGMIDADKDVDKVVLEKVNIDSMIKQITSGLMTQFKVKSIKLGVTSGGKYKVLTDRYKLSQSIFNLLTNAYKYTKEGGEVWVTSLIIGDKLLVKVQDTGIGISSEDKKKVFSAYFRGENSKFINGDGIGLYIARENIIQLGGNLIVNSELNSGSTFTIELPIYKDDLALNHSN